MDGRCAVNLELFGDMVAQMAPSTPANDKIWLCNKLANMAAYINHHSISGIRVSKGYIQSRAYREKVANGGDNCHDRRIRSNVTGKIYWIGCNYMKRGE